MKRPAFHIRKLRYLSFILPNLEVCSIISPIVFHEGPNFSLEQYLNMPDLRGMGFEVVVIRLIDCPTKCGGVATLCFATGNGLSEYYAECPNCGLATDITWELDDF